MVRPELTRPFIGSGWLESATYIAELPTYLLYRCQVPRLVSNLGIQRLIVESPPRYVPKVHGPYNGLMRFAFDIKRHKYGP